MTNLDEVRLDLLKEIDGLSDEVVNQRVTEEQWSIVQVLEHLSLLEQQVAKGLKSTIEEGICEKANQVSLERLLNRSVKVDAPAYTVPSNEIKTLHEAVQQLQNARETLLHTVEGVTEEQLKRLTMPHRRFGVLSLQDWLSLIGYHEQRHIMQIKEIKEDIMYSSN